MHLRVYLYVGSQPPVTPARRRSSAPTGGPATKRRDHDLPDYDAAAGVRERDGKRDGVYHERRSTELPIPNGYFGNSCFHTHTLSLFNIESRKYKCPFAYMDTRIDTYKLACKEYVHMNTVYMH